jgi:hypothetical protein
MARKKKSPFTKAEQDDIWRRYRLITAYDAGEPVEIDGVTFDLRCELDTKLWRPVAPLGTYGHRATLYGPKIIFPWTPDDWREALDRDGKAITAPPGSTIKIARIVSAPVDTGFEGFEDPESRERKLAYLFVFTPEFEMRLVEGAWLILAETATAIQIDMDDDTAAYRGLVAKLEAVMGVEDLEAMLDKPFEEWTKPSRAPPPSYGRAVLALKRAVDSGEEHAYAAFGYMMARAEAETQLLVAASHGRQAQANQAKATQARSEKSRRETEILRDLARRIIAREGDVSRTACANEIAEIVAADDTIELQPDSKWIAGHINELFERRPGPRVEYRPKRSKA